MTRYKQHGDFENLLLSFQIDSYEDMSDSETIEKFVKELDKDSILETLKEGKELLALSKEEFPEDWVADLTCKFPFSRWDEYPDGKVPPGDYRDWVKWMVEELEKEAKKQDKYEEIKKK